MPTQAEINRYLNRNLWDAARGGFYASFISDALAADVPGIPSLPGINYLEALAFAAVVVAEVNAQVHDPFMRELLQNHTNPRQRFFEFSLLIGFASLAGSLSYICSKNFVAHSALAPELQPYAIAMVFYAIDYVAHTGHLPLVHLALD